MIDYLNSNNINIEEVGSDFPMTGPFKYLDLSENSIAFLEKDLDTQKYVLYSNILNDFSDEQIDELSLNWQVVHKIEKCQIFMVLFQNPKYPQPNKI
jgi:hypothetical protein